MPSPSTPNAYPLDLTPPPISDYAAGNTGVPYAWRFDSGAPGPNAMISAVVHGNEPCGAIALDWLLKNAFRPKRGALTLLFANIAAYEAFDPADPNASRWVDEDFNRVWDPATLDGERDSVELRRAREIRPLLSGVDRLLDLHSMQHIAPPLMMAGRHPKGVALARGVGAPQRVVVDAGHQAGRRMRDYGPFGDPEAAPAALLLEAGQHWAASAAPLTKEAVARFLAFLGLDGGALLEALGADQAPETPQRVFEVTDAVTIQSEQFRFAQDFTGGEVLADAGTLIGHDGDREIRTSYANAMLIMPSRRLEPGLTAVRIARERRDL